MSNGDTTGALDLGARGGGCPCLMSILRNVCVTCPCQLFPPCSMSILINAYVPCPYLFRAHVEVGGWRGLDEGVPMSHVDYKKW